MTLFEDVLAALARGEAVALVTVIDARGSTPRHAGARMAVDVDGRILGTIGGGRIEQEAVAAAALVAGGGPARRVRHHLVRDLAMCCGGAMELWIAPAAPSAPALAAVVAARAARQPARLVTPLDGAPMRLEPVTDAAALARRPWLEADVFVEPIAPPERVILFGAGHVGRAIGPLAASCGYQIVLCDDDDTGALTAPPPWATAVVASFDVADVERALGPLGAGDHALIVTRDHAIDQRLLEQLIGNDHLGYLGMIGSRGKVGRFHKRLAAKGLAEPARWARLRAPVGLDLGAETPAEIAVAVVAELIALRRRGRPAAGSWTATSGGGSGGSTGSEGRVG